MRYPSFLQPGQTIGYVAPSFGASTEPYYSAFLNAVKSLEEKGYRTALGPNVFKGEGIGISTTPKACGEELTKYYLSPENDAIIGFMRSATFHRIIEDPDMCKLENEELLALYHAEGKQ